MKDVPRGNFTPVFCILENSSGLRGVSLELKLSELFAILETITKFIAQIENLILKSFNYVTNTFRVKWGIFKMGYF